MKKHLNWMLSVSLILIIASALAYTIHYLIFRDLHHIFIYMIGDFGFLFLDVLLVILLIERLLSRREKRSIMNKLNMVIGTFFSEVGLELLRKFSNFVINSQNLEKQLEFSPDWEKCIYCGLCVRMCAEQMDARAIGFADRGGELRITTAFDMKSEQNCVGRPLMSRVELEKVDQLVEKSEKTKRSLIPVLQEIQREHNWLPPEVLRRVAERLGVSLIDVYGVATFYRSLSLKPRGKHIGQATNTHSRIRGPAGRAHSGPRF